MHKNRVAQKRKIQVAYAGVTPEVARTVLQAINPEYITVRYFDPLTGGMENKEMYVGDRTAPVKWWWSGKKIFESLSFDLIER